MVSVKRFIRRIFRIGPDESFFDGINRKIYRIKKRYDKRCLEMSSFENALEQLGIKKGDTLIVHAAWRGCYMLNASPDDVLDVLLKHLGLDGTLLMPCYGGNAEFLDVKETPSKAGVLSECFRKRNGVIRSLFPQGTMCGTGKKASTILGEHCKSRYGYDEFSPYYKAIVNNRAKVLLLGMGKRTHKITAFHCASYSCRENIDFYKNVYQKKVNAVVRDMNGEEIHLEYTDRERPYSNNKQKFKKVFCKVKCERVVRKGLSMVVFEGYDAYKTAKKFCESGGKLYLTH